MSSYMNMRLCQVIKKQNKTTLVDDDIGSEHK